MKQEEKDKIIKTLEGRSANHPCPRCGNQQFSLADGYFSQPLQEKLGSLVFGGPAIPSVVVVCNQCGFISQHALGTLGLLPTPKQEEPKKEENKS